MNSTANNKDKLTVAWDLPCSEPYDPSVSLSNGSERLFLANSYTSTILSLRVIDPHELSWYAHGSGIDLINNGKEAIKVGGRWTGIGPQSYMIGPIATGTYIVV